MNPKDLYILVDEYGGWVNLYIGSIYYDHNKGEAIVSLFPKGGETKHIDITISDFEEGV